MDYNEAYLYALNENNEGTASLIKKRCAKNIAPVGELLKMCNILKLADSKTALTAVQKEGIKSKTLKGKKSNK